MGRNYNIKNLSANEMGKIQTLLEEGYNPSQIARRLEREKSCIYKEIKKYSYYTGMLKCSECLNREVCKQHFLCPEILDRRRCSICKDCSKAPKFCYLFKTEINCELLKKNHHVCNACEIKNRCKKVKIIYNANRAQKKHDTAQNISRKELKMDSLPKEFKDYISERIKLGQSPEVILNTLPDKYSGHKTAVSTLYNAIDAGCLNCCNLDLRNKVARIRYGSNTIKRNTIKNHHLNGRSIDDLSQAVKDNQPLGYYEKDTVEGIKGGELLFTLMIPRYSLLLAFKIEQKTQAEIKRVLDELEAKLGNNFYILFELGVPDNGGEFLDFDAIEKSIHYTEEYPLKRTSLFYAHPGASYEKPHIENAHILLRWLIKKGYDITLLSVEQILDIINRLNNYPRKKLDFKTPIRALEKELGEEVIQALGLEIIPIDILNMKDMILKDIDDVKT